MIVINVFNSFFGIWHAFIAKIQPPFLSARFWYRLEKAFPLICVHGLVRYSHLPKNKFYSRLL